MEKMLFLSLLAMTAIVACKKDSLGTKPVITFKSYSSSPVSSNGGMDVTFEVKDGDGDIEGTLNFAAIYDTLPDDTANYEGRPMPQLDAHKGSSLTAQVILHLVPTDFPQTGDLPIAKDSLYYKVYVVDDKGNHSDTIRTPKLEVQYQ
jgi:hypothetical protein